MKMLLSLILAVFTLGLFAQSPQLISYQAVLRDANGNILVNTNMTLNFKIHESSAAGVIVYEETHTTTSNAQGLVTLQVGGGNVISGNFSNINWASGNKFLHIAMNGGNVDLDLGTQQMLSVPYTLHTSNVGVRVSLTGDSLFIGNQLSIVPGVSAANHLYQPGAGITDIDGNFYPSVIINGEEWLAKNLAVSRYTNGDPIWNNIEVPDLGGALKIEPAYDENTQANINSTNYGYLYNWFVIGDQRKICPTGWHVPSVEEWDTLFSNVNSVQDLIVKYDTYNSNVPTNASGFGALSDFSSFGFGSFYRSTWWTNEAYYSDPMELMYLHECTMGRSALRIILEETGYNSDWDDQQSALAIRCKKNNADLLAGCMDISACNYNALANSDGGNCIYSGFSCDDASESTSRDVLNEGCVCEGFPDATPSYSIGDGVNDIEGNHYGSIIIGNQEWMSENLKTTKYQNSEDIPNIIIDQDWTFTPAKNGAYSYYENNTAYQATYGNLYNWYAVKDNRGLCPAGWHIPSKNEWQLLIHQLGGLERAGAYLKSSTGWENASALSNSVDFNALAGGHRFCGGNYDGEGIYHQMNIQSTWWSDNGLQLWTTGSVWANYGPWYVALYNNTDKAYMNYVPNPHYGMSVRCVR